MAEFDFYFAGSMSKNVEQYKLEHGANSLKSWVLDINTLKRNIQDKKDGKFKGKIMVDSGAFTAHRKSIEINCDDYIKFLNDNDEYLDAYIQLDKIPGIWGKPRTKEDILEAEHQSWENYKYMVTKLKSPFKLLAVFHQDESFENLKRLLDFKINGEYVKYICISGSKDRAPKLRTEWYHKCFEIIKSSNNPDVKVHCLGCSTLRDLRMFPFYSSDSSTWAQTAAYGGIAGESNIAISDIALKDSSKNYKFKILEEEVRKNCEKFGVNFDDVINKGWARAMYNVGFTMDWVKKNVVGMHFNTVKNKKLF